MPAIKGDMYINTHCNYSQPTLIKLDNENIGGHLTPLHSQCATRRTNVRVWPPIPCQVNAEIAEVDVTSRNWTRWRWSSNWTTALLPVLIFPVTFVYLISESRFFGASWLYWLLHVMNTLIDILTYLLTCLLITFLLITMVGGLA